MLQVPVDTTHRSSMTANQCHRLRWHRRSASTGSKDQGSIVLHIPTAASVLARAHSEDQLHELAASPDRLLYPPHFHWRRGSMEHAETYDTSSDVQQPKEQQQFGVAQLFARQMLQYSYPLVTPPPIVVEDPPSSDEAAAGDERHAPSRRRRVTHLNGSSGSSGNNTILGAKSAPPTPHGDRLQPGGPAGGGGGGAGGGGGLGNNFPAPPATAPSPATELPPPTVADVPPRSPSFSKHEKQVLKQLSTSTPSMTTAESEPPTPTPQGSSKARQKKFHRHFKQVPPEERVLNYYSCALVSDILLQGHLYITKNYFAFYSNVFGYVTKLLIPTASVLKVSKEKTAKIIPNAVGIATTHEKHVFGSLLSRDATYKLMIQVWKSATEPEAIEVLSQLEIEDAKDVEERSAVSVDAAIVDDEDSSLSGSGNDDSAIERSCSPTPIDTPTDMAGLSESKRPTAKCNKQCTSCGGSSRVWDVPDGAYKPERRKLAGVAKVNGTAIPLDRIQQHYEPSRSTSLPRPTVVLMLSTVLLVLLFLSAAFLLFRISAIQAQFAMHPVISSSDDIYQEILKWQIQLHSKSSNEVQQFLNNNLDQITKVRQSLEALSLLLVTENEERHRYRGSTTSSQSYWQQHPQQHHHPSTEDSGTITS